jgi:hypothetical protein
VGAERRDTCGVSPFCSGNGASAARAKRMTMSNEKIEQHCTAQTGEGSGNTHRIGLRSDCGQPTAISPQPGCGVLVGLRPGRRNSGRSQPQLHISKEGDVYLRTMLVQGAHYILGPFGEDGDLRRWGLELAERGGKNAKKRAVVDAKARTRHKARLNSPGIRSQTAKRVSASPMAALLRILAAIRSPVRVYLRCKTP